MAGEHNPLKVIKQPVNPEALEATALKRYQAWLEGNQKSQIKFLFSGQYQNLIDRLNKKRNNPDRMQPFLTPQAVQDYLALNDVPSIEDERIRKMHEVLFGELKPEKDLNNVIGKYGDLISRFNDFFLPPAKLKNSPVFSETSMILRYVPDLAEEAEPLKENEEDEAQQALEQMASHAPEKGELLLFREELADLRLTMINLANFIGRKQALAYFQHSFVYFLKDYLGRYGLNAPADLVFRVNPTVRENYEEHKRWVAAKDNDTKVQDNRQFLQEYIDDLAEQAGPLLKNLSQQKQREYKAKGLAEIVGRISDLAQMLSFGSEREMNAAKDFIKEFPRLFDFVRLILNTNNPIWQQETKKKEE